MTLILFIISGMSISAFAFELPAERLSFHHTTIRLDGKQVCKTNIAYREEYEALVALTQATKGNLRIDYRQCRLFPSSENEFTKEIKKLNLKISELEDSLELCHEAKAPGIQVYDGEQIKWIEDVQKKVKKLSSSSTKQ